MAKKRSFRSTPNILVTGTPGTGKTTFSRMLNEATGFRHVNVGDWVKERELHTGWDEEHQCFTLDEDKVRLAGLTFVHATPWAGADPAHIVVHDGRMQPAAGAPHDRAKLLLSVQVCDALELQMAEGGNIVDFHSCDFFPER
jgi:adenylate kinase